VQEEEGRHRNTSTHTHAHIKLNARPGKIRAAYHRHALDRSDTAPAAVRIPRTGTRGRRGSLQPAPAFPDIQHTRHLHPSLKGREAAMAKLSCRLARMLPPILKACRPWARDSLLHYQPPLRRRLLVVMMVRQGQMQSRSSWRSSLLPFPPHHTLCEWRAHTGRVPAS